MSGNLTDNQQKFNQIVLKITGNYDKLSWKLFEYSCNCAENYGKFNGNLASTKNWDES